MTTAAELFAEVSAAVEAALAQGQPVAATWLTHSIVNAHPDIAGADADWHRCNSYENVRTTVRKVLRSYAPSEEEEAERQLLLPGYDRLQKAYLVRRDKEQTVVPIELLTYEEITEKGDEYGRMGDGCYAHRAELFRYRDSKYEAAE